MSDSRTQTASEQLANLPGHILFSLARNESASPAFRKAATEILIDKGFPQASSPELYMIVQDIQKERSARHEVEAIVESAIEEEIPSGALRASVTTSTMYSDPVIHNASKLNDDAL